MATYVALLRGIGPLNPNMRSDKLRDAFEAMGFKNVRSVISTGNLLFDSRSQNPAALEDKIEKGLPKLLGFHSTTIIRSRAQLQQLVDRDPFGGAEHTPGTNLNITFLKTQAPTRHDLLALEGNPSYSIAAYYDREICSVVDLTTGKTPDLMVRLEREFGKDITTRTYKTIGMILKKMAA